MMIVLPPSIRLDQRGVQIRKVLWWGHLIPWSEAKEVQVQGRWQDTSSLTYGGGKSQRLIGMALEDAGRLAEALAAWRER